MSTKAAWSWAAVAAVLVAAVVVAAVVVAIGVAWASIGPSEITPAGWLAMILGILLTLGLGIGLMTLVFISSRRGYDEGRDR
jgi:ABC-type multidrug transport system permease subunit